MKAVNATGAMSSDFTWVVAEAGVVRHVRFEALSEVAGNRWTSMAEFNLLDAAGRTLSRSGAGGGLQRRDGKRCCTTATAAMTRLRSNPGCSGTAPAPTGAPACRW